MTDQPPVTAEDLHHLRVRRASRTDRLYDWSDDDVDILLRYIDQQAAEIGKLREALGWGVKMAEMRYTHAELTMRFMQAFQPAKTYGKPLWVRVMDAFCCGSTVAHEICRAHDMDPDMMVKQRRL